MAFDPGIGISASQSQVSGRFTPERNIYGRHGKLFIQQVINEGSAGDGLAGNQHMGTTSWLANVTEVSATASVEKTEVRMCGGLDVKYKPGEHTGEGTLTLDKINSEFEELFFDSINLSFLGYRYFNQPTFFLQISLEDPGIPGIQYDDNGFATTGHEMITLKTVKFWTLPMGYSTTEMVTRSMDFTFQCAEFSKGNTGGTSHMIDETNFTFPNRLC